MVKLGKVYQNLMVDVKATNEKLVDRAARIVVEATGSSRSEAEAALSKADGSAKVAIVMLLRKVNTNEALRRLELADGRVSDVVG